MRLWAFLFILTIIWDIGTTLRILGLGDALFTSRASLVLLEAKALASSFDGKTHEALIRKFSQVYDQLSDEDPSKINVTLRLADLLAEQGRSLANKQLGENCTICNAGEEERRRALSYYQEVLGRLQGDKKASVLIQAGHLQELMGLDALAIADYSQAIQGVKNPDLKAEAQFSLGELYFRKRSFSSAVQNYAAIVKSSDKKGRRGFAAYRLAWSLFNSGQYERATQQLISILKDPELQSRGVSHGVTTVDVDFKDEISRDLVIFSVKKGFQLKELEILSRLFRKETQLEHFFNLANELERLGQTRQALGVWSKLVGRMKEPVQKWEAYVRYSNLLRESRDFKTSLKIYKKAVALGDRQKACSMDECQEIRSRQRHYILDWHKSLKKPTLELAQAYDIYNKYANLMDTEYWGAEIYFTLGDKKAAFLRFRRSVDKFKVSEAFYKKKLAQEKQESQKFKNQTQEKNQASSQKKEEEGGAQKRLTDLYAMLEKSLLKRVEIAEKLELSYRREAYKEYLTWSRSQDQKSQIQYQLAHLNYENKEYMEAFKDFKDFVQMTREKAATDKGIQKIRLQAGDLALDALVLAQKEDLLIEAATVLSQQLPERTSEYDAIIRKALINQSMTWAQKETLSGYKKALDILKSGDFSHATQEEKKLIVKNKIILAEKLKDVSEANGYVTQFLNLPNLSEEEKQFAYKKQAWLSELMLDFPQALSATRHIKDLKEPQRTLQLALLTDLSGGDSSPLFEEYVKKRPKDSASLEMVMILMEESETPWKDFKRFQDILLTSEQNWKKALLISYEVQPLLEELKTYIHWNTIDKKKRNEILQMRLFKPVLEQAQTQLVKMNIDSSSQKAMTRTIKSRMAEIKKYEDFVAQVLKSQLWFGQVYALNILSQESKRFYEEVMLLPIPEGLTPEEQNQYMNLLSQSASPYLAKHNQIRTKLEDIWSQRRAVKRVFKDLVQQPRWIQSLWLEEYEGLTSIAPEKFKDFVQKEKKDFKKSVAQKREKSKDIPLEKVVRLKGKVMTDPFNKSLIEELLAMEKQRKQAQMVIYLNQRLSKLDQIKEEAIK